MHNRNHWGMGIAYLTYLFYFKTARISMMSMTLSPLHGKKQIYNGKNVAVGLRTFVWDGVLHLLRRFATGIF